jgi:phosphoglycerate dehydrogenase-like enzyme
LYANAASVHEASTAELALALILASERHLDDFVRDAMTGTWRPRPAAGLAGRHVVVLGAGGVGAAVIERLRPFDVELSIVASTERASELGLVHGVAALDGLLATTDILVVCLPLTARTRDVIDDRRLSLLPDGSLVVNVGRGPTINGAALARHAESGRIRVASDVFDPEPLPVGHAFYSLANVIIAPHVGGGTSGMLSRVATLVRQQIDRLARAEPPLNVVISTWPTNDDTRK